MCYRPGSEDVTGAVAWVSAQSTLVFWFNKNCASRGPWGRRHRGTRDPARSRARPGERRSVHKSAKMASRSCFGSFVYTVATCEGRARGRGDAGVYTDWRKWPLGAVLRHLCTLLRCCRQMWRRRSVHRSAKMTSRRRFGAFVYTVVTRGSRASGAAARLAPLPRQQPTQTPEEPAIETGQVSGPIGARFGRFRLVGRLWCVERCARLTKRAVPDDLHDPLAQDVPSPYESEAHYRRDVAEHVELDELPEPPMALSPIPEGYANSPSLRGASRRQRLGSG